MYGDFKQQCDKIAYEKIWSWLRLRETESLFIATQNNAFGPIISKRNLIILNRIANIDQLEKNETVNHISQCSKLEWIK